MDKKEGHPQAREMDHQIEARMNRYGNPHSISSPTKCQGRKSWKASDAHGHAMAQVCLQVLLHRIETHLKKKDMQNVKGKRHFNS